jgi:hypothetical protein
MGSFEKKDEVKTYCYRFSTLVDLKTSSANLKRDPALNDP